MPDVLEKNVICSCGANLVVRNRNNSPSRTISCPICHQQLTVEFDVPRANQPASPSPTPAPGVATQYEDSPAGNQPVGVPPNYLFGPNAGAPQQPQPQPQQPAEVPTDYYQQPVGGATDYHPEGGSAGHIQQTPKTPQLIYNGTAYSLSDGENLVGRSAQSDNLATVRIVTPDKTMSRNHAIINITRQPGGGITASIRNWKNMNTTSINGCSLNDDDQLLLTNGVTISMGDVVLYYQEV